MLPFTSVQTHLSVVFVVRDEDLHKIQINRYKIKVLQVYALTPDYNDEDVERFYEDVEEAMKCKTQYSFMVGNFNNKYKIEEKKP